MGVRLVLLRCAGFNNVDLAAAKECGITVLRVPAYSPYAVAEHAMAILQQANRHLHKSYNKVKDNNYALSGLFHVPVDSMLCGSRDDKWYFIGHNSCHRLLLYYEKLS